MRWSFHVERVAGEDWTHLLFALLTTFLPAGWRLRYAMPAGGPPVRRPWRRRSLVWAQRHGSAAQNSHMWVVACGGHSRSTGTRQGPAWGEVFTHNGIRNQTRLPP